MLRIILFDLLLFGSCAYALIKGTRDAQIVAATALVANFASYLVVSGYGGIEVGVLAIDVLVLAAFTGVALKSDRFWPLWIAGLQLTTTFGHLLRAVEEQMLPIAYAVSLRFWVYPIHIILIIAVWRSQGRAHRANSPLSV